MGFVVRECNILLTLHWWIWHLSVIPRLMPFDVHHIFVVWWYKSKTRKIGIHLIQGAPWSWSYVKLDLQLHIQSVPIITKLVSSNSTHIEVSSIQHYMIKFVSDLQQVVGFLCVLRILPPINLTAKCNNYINATNQHWNRNISIMYTPKKKSEAVKWFLPT
jgi:hypothetical protein